MVWYGFSMVQFKGILPNLATDLGFILICTLGLSSSLQAFPTGRRRFYGLITWAPLHQKLCSFIYVNIFICTYIYICLSYLWEGIPFHVSFCAGHGTMMFETSSWPSSLWLGVRFRWSFAMPCSIP